ncbi:hypothetical protein L2E82_34106 [Cichorium intybus]|uniref:Uncharacterized protein n=1 Tax=Cichorium intybus TaxID=13427 RepID=A0ACB9BLK2_CICIN|nr:hypothetical protein L2E82_34106 [Cichorium intybus]
MITWLNTTHCTIYKGKFGKVIQPHQPYPSTKLQKGKTFERTKEFKNEQKVERALDGLKATTFPKFLPIQEKGTTII